LEILTTVASGLIDADIGVYPGTPMQSGNVSHTPCENSLAFSPCLALRAGVIQGLDRLVFNVIGLRADESGISHEGSS
jgi:hypothetical protein